MTYISSIELTLWIKKSIKLAFYEIIFGILIFLFFSIMMYLKANSFLLLFIGVLGLAVFLTIYTYGSIINKPEIINQTISKIKLEDKSISIETFSCNVLLQNRKSKLINVDLSDIKFSEHKYPILDKNTIKNKVLVFLIKDKEYYLILDFFEKDLKNKLKSFHH